MAKKKVIDDNERAHLRAFRPVEPQRVDLDSVVAQQPENVREELEALRKHEKTVLAALKKDPKLHDRFLQDPIAVLTELKVPLSPSLKRRVADAGPAAARLKNPATFVMPDGQTFTPNIRVRIIEGA